MTGWKGREGSLGLNFWYWVMEREDFFLLKERRALFLSSSFLGRGFLLSRKRVAGVCLFLAIIELFKFVAIPY